MSGADMPHCRVCLWPLELDVAGLWWVCSNDRCERFLRNVVRAA